MPGALHEPVDGSPVILDVQQQAIPIVYERNIPARRNDSLVGRSMLALQPCRCMTMQQRNAACRDVLQHEHRRSFR